jgi:hypothetical protein
MRALTAARLGVAALLVGALVLVSPRTASADLTPAQRAEIIEAKGACVATEVRMDNVINGVPGSPGTPAVPPATGKAKERAEKTRAAAVKEWERLQTLLQ